MTLEEFSEILHYQEPDFYYHGNGYTICWARGYFPDVDLGVAPFDGTAMSFDSSMDWMICWTTASSRESRCERFCRRSKCKWDW